MFSDLRGRIPAIAIMLYFVTVASGSTVKTSSFEPAGQSVVAGQANQLSFLGASYLPESHQPNFLGIDRLLEDNRAALPAAVELPHEADFASFADFSLTPAGNSGTEIRFAETSHDPIASSSVNVVPVPILTVGWGIVLFGVLFYIGTHVLGLRRRITS